jgi:uncharacterized membrane protein YecN with MAPEG domain
MPIVALYAAVLAIVFVLLSVRVVRLRGRARATLGDAGDAVLQRAIRVHGNFAEYVPFGLLLIFFAETGGAAAGLVHALCGCLVAGRLVHAYGVSQVRETLAFRVAGMVLTFTALLGSASYILARSF